MPSLVGSEMCIRDSINPPMRCSTWRGNDLTKLNRQVQLWVCPRFEPPTPHLCISYTGGVSAVRISHSFPVPAAGLIPSPSSAPAHCGVQQVQATSDRSRISTKACSPIACVTGCATKSQLYTTSFLCLLPLSLLDIWPTTIACLTVGGRAADISCYRI